MLAISPHSMQFQKMQAISLFAAQQMDKTKSDKSY